MCLGEVDDELSKGNVTVNSGCRLFPLSVSQGISLGSISYHENLLRFSFRVENIFRAGLNLRRDNVVGIGDIGANFRDVGRNISQYLLVYVQL